MMIDQAFQTAIKLLYATNPLLYGSAEGQSGTYHVMIKVADAERPDTLCQEQGDSGRALFQFSTYGENAPTIIINLAETLKDIVADVKGVIGTAPNKFSIYNNMTSSVTLINEGSSSLNVWGVIFESEIWWTKI